jgi:hypothetical protein
MGTTKNYPAHFKLLYLCKIPVRKVPECTQLLKTTRGKSDLERFESFRALIVTGLYAYLPVIRLTIIPMITTVAAPIEGYHRYDTVYKCDIPLL